MYSYIFWPWIFYVLEFSMIDPGYPSVAFWGRTWPWLFTSRLLIILMLFSILSLECCFRGPFKQSNDLGALFTPFASVCKNHGKNAGGSSWLFSHVHATRKLEFKPSGPKSYLVHSSVIHLLKNPRNYLVHPLEVQIKSKLKRHSRLSSSAYEGVKTINRL